MQHGARHHADVLAELGAHQDDGGGRWQGGLAGAVGAGHRLPLRACYPDTCAPSWNSFQVMPSCSALNDASMMLVETPLVVQRRPLASAPSIISRVTARVPACGRPVPHDGTPAVQE